MDKLLHVLKGKKIFIIAITAGLFLLAAIIVASFMLNTHTIYKGISLEGIQLTGLEKMQAEQRVKEHLQNTYNKPSIKIQCQEATWDLPLKSIGFEFMVEEALEKAYSIGRKGNIFERLFTIFKVRNQNVDIICRLTYDKEKLKNFLTKKKKSFDKKMKNASVTFTLDGIIVHKDIIGRILDIDGSLDVVENRIGKRVFDNIKIEPKLIMPEISYNEVKDIKVIKTEFSTYFNPYDKERTHNLDIACKKLSGTVVLPGQVFSMNKVLGPRTKANGYQEAKIFINNEVTMGEGGGVCQVTSTLYNAILLSKLQVVTRHPHSLLAHYVEPSRDATIAGDYYDFKFKNTSDYAIVLHGEIAGNQLKIRLLARKSSEFYTVKLRSETIEKVPSEEVEYELDNEVPDGITETVQHAAEGIRSILYREVYNKNGELLDIEKISEDYYKPLKAKVKANQKYMDENGIIDYKVKEG